MEPELMEWDDLSTNTREQPVEVVGASLDNSCLRCEENVEIVSDETQDDITLRTIDLLHYSRNIRKQLYFYRQENNSRKAMKPPSPIPELPEGILKHRRSGTVQADTENSLSVKFEKRNLEVENTSRETQLNSSVLNCRDVQCFNELDWPSFSSRGFSTTPPVISRTVCWKILRKSVAIIFAHAGYEIMTDVLLDMITDIAQDYFIRFCQVFRKNSKNTANTIDVLEQTFHDIGMESITILHHFYQSRIVDYYENALSNCKLLMEEYENLRNQKGRYRPRKTPVQSPLVNSDVDEDLVTMSDVPLSSNASSSESPGSVVEKFSSQKSPKREVQRKRRRKL